MGKQMIIIKYKWLPETIKICINNKYLIEVQELLMC